jgi:hypothetical protein
VESSGVGSIHGTDHHANYQNQTIIVRWIPFTRQQSHWVDSRRMGRRQLATSSSGRKVDTDSPRPPSIVVADPLCTCSLLDDLADVGLASRRVPGDCGCSTGVGLVQALSLFVPGSLRAVSLFQFLWMAVPQRKGVTALSPLCGFATQDPALGQQLSHRCQNAGRRRRVLMFLWASRRSCWGCLSRTQKTVEI